MGKEKNIDVTMNSFVSNYKRMLVSIYKDRECSDLIIENELDITNKLWFHTSIRVPYYYSALWVKIKLDNEYSTHYSLNKRNNYAVKYKCDKYNMLVILE